METNQTNNNRRLGGKLGLLIGLVIGIVLGAFVYGRFAGTSTPQRPLAAAPAERVANPEGSPALVQISAESQRDVGITFEPAVRRRLTEALSATGTVSEDPGRVAHIRPLARGVVEKTYVRLGDRVSVGDPLVEYDNIELGLAIGDFLSAEAELQQSLTDLEVKKKILERSRAMLREGAVAQTAHDIREAEYKDAEAKATGARATVAKITEQIHRFGWTDRDLANLPSKQGATNHSVSHTILRAPFPGVITSYHASIGETVEPSTELLAITDLSSLWVLADVFEKDLAHIRPGKAAQVSVPSYPGKVFPGKITHLADAVDPKTRTVKARCVVENSGGLLKLEMFATIGIPVEQANPVLAVPDAAVQQIEGKSYVFIRTAETDFQKREVQTGMASGGYTEIRSGLKDGETVVNRGSFVVKTVFLRHLIGEKE